MLQEDSDDDMASSIEDYNCLNELELESTMKHIDANI